MCKCYLGIFKRQKTLILLFQVMGNCQCQKDAGLEFEHKQEISLNPIPHPAKPQPPRISSQPVLPKHPNHEPSPEFATPIAHFPQLSRKIVDTDERLKRFQPSTQNLWNESYKPVYIDKSYKLHNGTIYQGEWHNGRMNGKGVFYLPDGCFIRGVSINNELVGEARFIRENGNYYQGQIKNNQANGQGEMFENGVTYQGNFVNNYLEGNGNQSCPQYNFQGKYHKGAKIYGKLTWDLDKNPPTVYEGGFFDEQFNGEGRLANQIGDYRGSFQNGKKKGRGIFTWKNGDRFEGNYDSDLKNGEGRMFNNKNVVVLQGYWQNDKFKN